MSRIGRMPIAVPAGVTVDIAENNHVTVKGPKGTLERTLPTEMEIKKEGDEIIVTRPNDLKKMKSLHGLTRTLIHNMTIGVSEGYTKTLEVNGVGYRAAKAGKKLTLKPSRTPITSTQKFTYKSSNKKIATVSSKGVIKGKKTGKAKKCGMNMSEYLRSLGTGAAVREAPRRELMLAYQKLTTLHDTVRYELAMRDFDEALTEIESLLLRAYHGKEDADGGDKDLGDP